MEDEIEEEKPSPKNRESVTKISEEGFRGGMPIDLDRTLEGHSRTLRDELGDFVKRIIQLELRNQQDRVDRLAVWEEQYFGKHEETDFPFEGAASLSPPITAVNIDAIFVRVWDAIWSKRLLWLVKAKSEDLVDEASSMEKFLDFFQKNIVHLKQKYFSPVMQGLQSGTGLGKIVYERKVRTVYRRASPDEIGNGVHTYPIWNSEARCVKIVDQVYNGPNYYPLAREDFVISSDATSFDDAFLCAYRFYLRKPQIQARIDRGYYHPDTLKKIQPEQKKNETKERRAETQFIETDFADEVKPYEFWEAYLSYDVDGDGEEDDIVVVINLQSGTVAYAIYQPLFSGSRPFNKITPVPVPYRFDGRGFCEALEPIQAEIDYFHNQRINRLIEINSPMIIVRAGIGLNDLELSPAKVWFTDFDVEKSIKFIPFPEIYPSTEREEDRLVDLARQICGITQAVLGESTAERPVARETFARIQEANRKFANIIDNVRLSLIELAFQFLEFFSQYQPTYKWKSIKETGEIEESTVTFPVELIRQSFDIDLEVSSEVMNREVRREINLTIYQLLSDYMTKLASMLQALVSPQTPSDFKKAVLDANRISVEVIRRILQDYEIPDPETFVLDLEKVIDTEKLIASSPDLQPPKEENAPPQGPPGQPMPMTPPPQFRPGPTTGVI